MTHDFDRSLVRGLAWTGIAKWLTQVFAWIGTLLVARLLTPSDYGIVTMAQLLIGLVSILSEFGIGAAVVTVRELTAGQLAQLNALCVILGLLAFAVSIALVLPLSHFFAAPELPAVLVAMAFSLVLTSLQTVPSGSLQRELRFRTLAGIDMVRGLVVPITTLLLALAGLGYWSLVLSALLSAAITTVLTIAARRHAFSWPRFQALRDVIGFSSHILVSRISWYTYANADFAVAGRVLGQGPLGVYTVAWTVATSPMEKVTGLVTGVAPGFFSAVQSDTATLRRYFLNLTEALALITLPLAVGAALVAEEFVLLALGPKWQAASEPLRLLALYASFRSVTTVLPPVLNVLRETRLGMWNGVFSVILLPIAFYIGSEWGAVGIAAAWLVCYPVIVAPIYARVFKRLELSLGEYFRVLRSSLDGTIAMAAAVLGAQWILPPDWPLVARFVIDVAGGALVFGGVTLTLHRERVSAIYERLRAATRHGS